MRGLVLLLFLCVTSIFGQNIQYQCIDNGPRANCGYYGIDQQQCEAKNCCWNPVTDNSLNLPYCYFKQAVPPNPPNGAPFSQKELDLMAGYWMTNFDILGLGGIVASPDTDTGPGGSYYYHWMRDGALSMRTLMLLPERQQEVQYLMQNYVSWVLRAQNETDPNHIDVRVEPKFFLPYGQVFNGSWCRPQTDGPALRAGTLSLYGLYLLNHTKEGANFVKEFLFTSGEYHGGAIQYDLAWVVQNWPSNGCDLWEEVESDDFFWNRYNMRFALNVGAELANKLGLSSLAKTYLTTASQIQNTLGAHYNGKYIYESTNRMEDSAVLMAINDGYLNDGYLSPTSYEVTGTLSTLSQLFASAFEINKNNSYPLFGRYQGDTYDGGNPWILTTAAVAELYYNGASEVIKSGALPYGSLSNYAILLSKSETELKTMKVDEFADALVSTGDGYLLRLREYVAPYNFHLSEQLDKVQGFQLSAYDLTWSYSNLFKAMHYRTHSLNAIDNYKLTH